MKLILFIHQDSAETGITLKKIIDQKFNETQIHTLHTFNTFKARLKQLYNHNNEIFILLADCKYRLTELTSLIDLMESKRIILILPDDSKSSTLMAHQFFPRYFTYINDTYADLCAVITQMTIKMKLNTNEHR